HRFMLQYRFCSLQFSLFFSDNDTSTTYIYTLSLHDALPIFLLVGLGGVNHSQCSAGDTEHHAGEEAGHVHTEAVAVGSSGSASPELTEVVDADGGKPEYGDECVVQTEGNEQTVEERVDTSADSTQADDTGTQSNQSAVNDRPYEEQDGSHDDGNDCGNDCNAALTGEERECVGQLGVLE